MTTNTTTVTAARGAGTSPEEAPAEEFREFNSALRLRFLECNVRIQAAKANHDPNAEQVARRDREAIAGLFVEKNTRLARSLASPMTRMAVDGGEEYVQAAVLGLWEAFVGSDPDAVDGVIVADDGTLHPTGGWDPAKGTFATWAKKFISGRVARSVRASEGGGTGISYNTWGQKPLVDASRRELTEELGHTPSYAQIAERAGLTEETVRVCSQDKPVSLQARLGGDDNDGTLGDLIANSATQSTSPGTDWGTEILTSATDGMRTVDLMVLLLRTGVTSDRPRSVVQTADRLGIKRGQAQNALDRAKVQLATSLGQAPSDVGVPVDVS